MGIEVMGKWEWESSVGIGMGGNDSMEVRRELKKRMSFPHTTGLATVPGRSVSRKSYESCSERAIGGGVKNVVSTNYQSHTKKVHNRCYALAY